jgi:DGQHR domain-containing protein
MTKLQKTLLLRKALRVRQKGGRFIYLLSLRGEELLQLASVSRVSRDDSGKLIGYQRKEVKRHVQEIADYLSAPDMLLAHPIIVSFGSNVKFVSSRGQNVSDGLACAGHLKIPVPRDQQEKPAWIVDGQQRALAIGLCQEQGFAVPICAFIADDVELQRDQFMRINNTKPLPRGLVTELLPEVSSPLPPHLAIRRVPSTLCDLLNRDQKSPFNGLIHRPSNDSKDGQHAVVTDTVIVKMIEESLTQPSGCLFPYRNVATGEYDHSGIWAVLQLYWSAVRETFPDAWGKPPTQSRLMHGVGIRSMGKLMDRIMATVDPRGKDAYKTVRQQLATIAPACHWTSGEWAGLGGIAWNELQNLHTHLSMLSNYLIRAHIDRRAETL